MAWGRRGAIKRGRGGRGGEMGEGRAPLRLGPRRPERLGNVRSPARERAGSKALRPREASRAEPAEALVKCQVLKCGRDGDASGWRRRVSPNRSGGR